MEKRSNCVVATSSSDLRASCSSPRRVERASTQVRRRRASNDHGEVARALRDHQQRQLGHQESGRLERAELEQIPQRLRGHHPIEQRTRVGQVGVLYHGHQVHQRRVHEHDWNLIERLVT